MTKEVKQQKAAEVKKSKTLSNLLSTAFCKSVVINLRGVKLTLEQPAYKDVLQIQLDTIKEMGDMRDFIIDPEKMKGVPDNRKEEILEEVKYMRDRQTVKLLRLCCNDEELEEVPDDVLQMVIEQTGGDSAPIVVAVKKLTGTYEDDLIQDDPFFRRTSI